MLGILTVSLQSVMHPVVLRVVVLLRALERAPSVLLLVVREVVGQRVGVAEAAVAGGAAVELLHQAHLIVRSGSISGNWNMIFHFFLNSKIWRHREARSSRNLCMYVLDI